VTAASDTGGSVVSAPLCDSYSGPKGRRVRDGIDPVAPLHACALAREQGPLMHRPANSGRIVTMLFVLIAFVMLTFDGGAASAAGDHVDPVPHATPEAAQTSHGTGCHTVGACHQVSAPFTGCIFGSDCLGAMLRGPSSQIAFAEAPPEFDTPPPRA